MPGRQPAKANIYDVAKLAGVSHQTVSRVMNNHPSIRPATRARVEAAAKQLNYRPSMAARALVTKKNSMLGFIVGDTGLYGPRGMLNAMEKQARLAGYYSLTVAIKQDSPESWSEGIEHLHKIGVEGLVCIAIKREALELAAKMNPGIPIVSIDTEEIPGVTTVGIDNELGARIATEHLIELGHKNILHVAGPRDSIEARARLAGFKAAMKAAKLKPHVVQGDWTAATGYQIGSELDIDVDGITGIFTANDAMALGMLKAFRLRRISVPKRVSLIGFDDVPEAPYFEPPLTTVLQDFNNLGRAAMGNLIQRLSGEQQVRPVDLPPSIILRESTSRLK